MFDADGSPLPAQLRLDEGQQLAYVIDDRDARYPLTIDPCSGQVPADTRIGFLLLRVLVAQTHSAIGSPVSSATSCCVSTSMTLARYWRPGGGAHVPEWAR